MADESSSKKPSKDEIEYTEIKSLDELTEEMNGKPISITGRCEGFAVRFSPPFKLIDDESGKKQPTGMAAKSLDLPIKITNGMLWSIDKNQNGYQSINSINHIIAFFNIVGIPFDFAMLDDQIMLMKGLGEDLPTISSAKALRRGTGLEPIEIKFSEIVKVFNALSDIWRKYKTSKLAEMGDIYKFLGYARYYYFHTDYHLSFVNGFIFLESVIDIIWNKLILDKFKEKGNSPLENEREWTMMIKIDELFMLGFLTHSQRITMQALRKKRNDIFHADKRPERRTVSQKDAFSCIQMGLMMLYRVIEMDKEQFDFFDLRERISKTVHENYYGTI